jgi:hypothetical protein
MDAKTQIIITAIVQIVVGIVTVVALILGPRWAVKLSEAEQSKRESRNRRLSLFQVLMACRKDPFNMERVKALAQIDIVFYDQPKVRQKWDEYYAALNDPNYVGGKNDGLNVWARKQNYLLAEMATPRA